MLSAAGFLGQALAKALASTPGVNNLVLTDAVEPPKPTNTVRTRLFTPGVLARAFARA
jgi:nucleoside-diphosphate-sugar epimerase